MKKNKKIFPFIIAMLFACTGLFAQKGITVAQDGSGNYTSIQEAINSLPASAKKQRYIFIKKGIYNEKLFIDKDFITLQGEDPSNTIISIALAREEWRCSNPDDYGTATLNLKGSDITLENLSFLNTYGKDNTTDRVITCAADSGKSKTIKPFVHQMALRSFATTRLIVINCIFRAYGGDTVSPWNTEDGMFYFKDCTMEGGVDFYCPRGWAYADNCTFICHSMEAAIWHDGSKYESSKTVLVNCKFKGDDNFKLGRYHRDAQFYLLNCSFPKNMADADIYQREANPPNKIQWGKRVYYYNCHKEGGDYNWHKNNLPSGISAGNITSAWAFDNKWDPAKNAGMISDKKVTPAETNSEAHLPTTDPIAENMLLYQRSNGGWPKHFQGDRKVDYKRQLTDAEKKELLSGFAEGMDATIDNEATTREIKYLVTAYKKTENSVYLKAAEKGVDYLLQAQYANGGWPQYYPDFSIYRSEITYNDNAMINVMNVLQDILEEKNDMDAIVKDKSKIDTSYTHRCSLSVQRGINCILKTQLKQKGKLTAWCAQYDAKTLQAAKARMYELPSLSGMESVGIVRFLMRIDQPSNEIKTAVNSAVEWFNKVKITGYKFIDIKAPNEPSGKDRVFVPDSEGGVIWARFYDMDTNEPFFSGRDSQRKKTIAEVENERRIGYAWYGNWPERLLKTEYPAWLEKWGKN